MVFCNVGSSPDRINAIFQRVTMPNSVADLENFVFVSFAFFVVQVFEDAIEDVVLEAPAVEGEVPLGQGLLEAQIAIGMEGAHCECVVPVSYELNKKKKS